MNIKRILGDDRVAERALPLILAGDASYELFVMIIGSITALLACPGRWWGSWCLLVREHLARRGEDRGKFLVGMML